MEYHQADYGKPVENACKKPLNHIPATICTRRTTLSAANAVPKPGSRSGIRKVFLHNVFYRIYHIGMACAKGNIWYLPVRENVFFPTGFRFKASVENHEVFRSFPGGKRMDSLCVATLKPAAGDSIRQAYAAHRAAFPTYTAIRQIMPFLLQGSPNTILFLHGGGAFVIVSLYSGFPSHVTFGTPGRDLAGCGKQKGKIVRNYGKR